MTAQVLIITKESVVCSSDQAATMSDGKTYWNEKNLQIERFASI